MKRFLHALAALWPQRKEVVSPPVPPMSTGIRQHLAAVIRMERHVSECADSRICKSANETLGAVALNERSVLDVGLNLSEREQSNFANHQINDSTTRRLTESTAHQINDSTTRRFIDSPIQQIVDSPNHLTSLPRIPQPMPLLTILMLVFFMCLMAAKQVSAQAEPAAAAVIKPLQIGDTIPEELWHLPLQVVNHPKGKETITLNDYRGKLIILDFWATWCAPCISSLHKLDELQDQFAEDLAVIPTTYEQSEKVAKFFQERGWNLPTATTDRMLKNYFPYQSIPHQVWLKDGKLLAVAGHEYANEHYINSIVQGEYVDFKHKIEVPFDRDKPLFLDGNGGDGSNMLYQSVISGRLHARVGGLSMPDSNQLLAYNQTVFHLYSIALGYKISPFYNQDYIRKYVIYELPDTLKYRIDPEAILSNTSIKEKESWADENLYCYNLVLPNHVDPIRRKEVMLRDLNVFFSGYLNIQADFSKRQVNALSLIRSSDSSMIATKGGDPLLNINPFFADKTIFVNKPVSSLIHLLNSRLSNEQKPIVDKTGIQGNIDISINLYDSDIESINEQLSQNGLFLVESNELVDMIVFTTPR